MSEAKAGEYKHNTQSPYALYLKPCGEWAENASVLNTDLPIINSKHKDKPRDKYIRDIQRYSIQLKKLQHLGSVGIKHIWKI